MSTGGAPEAETETVQGCPGVTRIDTSRLPFAPCDLEGCSDALCVPEDRVAELLGDFYAPFLGCPFDAGVCIPRSHLEVAGLIQTKACRADGHEARCVSRCLLYATRPGLTQDTCGDSERCVPCFDPDSGDSTDACQMGCDSGPY
jgi:hypothetical protein